MNYQKRLECYQRLAYLSSQLKECYERLNELPLRSEPSTVKSERQLVNEHIICIKERIRFTEFELFFMPT